ncbi:MAG: hypothetical protein NZ929_07335 [Aigarchaeota archaeon]|nr:hypothetical protein [Aigarchaeota archaeon]MCX8193162.1 hypothetical protein [Nitrososphaeria archaeon]MDW7986303.1 hypothetical protein [Nitrososphaerota archaeon]
MVVKVSNITNEIVNLISRDNVVGLATHRHLPHEKAIYMRHGKCGFAVDVMVEESGAKVLYSILVTAEAKPKKKIVENWMEHGGRIVYYLTVKTDKGFKVKKRFSTYKNGEELFKQVEEVRQAFYRKYRDLKMKQEVVPTKVEEEVFHMVGIEERDLFLGV